tara:strand:+ start:298 stop:456 length:159 start_codon:yes stop_codon:yes gene_type:complete
MTLSTPIIDEKYTFYKSINDAAKRCGISRQCITANLSGKSKTTFGKKFTYLN